VALLASSIKHADDLSRALDARCYEGGSARSHWHPLAYSRRDVAAFLITAAYAALLIWLGTL
jgi:energy-coupling factor transporter transmembrane protein EcfT